MEIRQLKYFVEIVKEGGYTAAAAKLYISQSSISKAISKIEKELGYELFEPRQKRPVLTKAGQRLYEKSVQLVKDYDNFSSQLSEDGAMISGRVTVGIPPLISTCYFAPIIANFTKMFPQVEIALIEKGAIGVQNSVDKELIDIGIVILPVYDGKFDVINLVSDETVLVVSDSHPLSSRMEVTYSDLKNERFILFNKEYTLYHQITANCRRAGYEPEIVAMSGSWDYMTELAALQFGVAIMPRPIFTKRTHNDISLVRMDSKEASWDVVQITKKDRELSNCVKSFVKYTKDHFAF